MTRVEPQLVAPTYTYNYPSDAFGREIGIHNSSTGWAHYTVDMAGRRIFLSSSATRWLFHANALGSTTMVTDQTGASVQDTTFYPWGQEWQGVGSLGNWSFAAFGPTEPGTTLYPTLFRRFSSTQGRWLSPDQAGGDASNPQSWNRYAYVLNQPTVSVDPLGLQQAAPWSGNCTPNGYVSSNPGCSWNGGARSNTDCGEICGGSAIVSSASFMMSGYGGDFTEYKYNYVSWGENPSSALSCYPASACYQYDELGLAYTPPPPLDNEESYLVMGREEVQISAPTTPMPSPPGSISWQIGSGLTISAPKPYFTRDNGMFRPNVPPKSDYCSAYRDGTGAGDILYKICMGFPNSPWSNCVRGKLLQQFVPNDNPPDLIFRYGFFDHTKDFITCRGK